MEEWKQIDDTIYEVSNEGRVRRKLKDPRAIKKYNGCYKYLKVVLHRGHKTNYFDVSLGGKRRELVHRLVAKMFIPNPENKPQVNHINGKGQDNRSQNLEWCTDQENTIHASKSGLLTPSFGRKKIYCIELNRYFSSSYEAAMYINEAKFKNSHRTKSLACNIRSCGNGQRPKAYGYTWSYK